MKILIGRSSCKILFEENDKYTGRTVLLAGEGNLCGEFLVYKSNIHDMCWTDPSNADPNHFIYVDVAIRDEVLSYIMEGAKKEGLSINLW